MKGILYVCELGVMVLNERLDPINVWKYPDDTRIEIYDALKRGELTPELMDLVSKSIRGLDELIVIDDNLRKELGKKGIVVEEASNELIDELWDKKIDLIIRADFANSEEDAKDKIRDFAIALTESRLREVSARQDLHIMEAIQALDEVDKASNLLATRVREWYGLHFPELSSLIDDPFTYTRLVKEFGERKNFGKEELVRFGLSIKKAEAISLHIKRSEGGKIREEDLEMVSAISEEAFRLNSLRDRLSIYVEKNMGNVAPNITSVVGATIGARLIAKAGGLEKLAMLPASTIQVLGAEKALFRALRTGSRPPKHGIIFQHQAIHSAPKWQRGKIARSIAGKIAIASRIDAFRGSAEKEIEQKLQKRLEEIKVKYGEPPIGDQKVRKKGRKGCARGL